MLTKLKSESVKALKSKNVAKRLVLKNLINLVETTQKEKLNVLSDNEIIDILDRYCQKRIDQSLLYKQQNRPELYNSEMYEIKIIKQFLPTKMSDVELEDIVKTIIQKNGYNNKRNIKDIMVYLTQKYNGQYDKKIVGKLCNTLLS